MQAVTVPADHPYRLVQPLGAIMTLAEAQAAWVPDLVDGSGRLPSYDGMRRQIREYDERLDRRYVSSKQHTIQVDFHACLAEVRRERRESQERAGTVAPRLTSRFRAWVRARVRPRGGADTDRFGVSAG